MGRGGRRRGELLAISTSGAAYHDGDDAPSGQRDSREWSYGTDRGGTGDLERGRGDCAGWQAYPSMVNHPQQTSLAIRLTEPCVFLRGEPSGDARGAAARRRRAARNANRSASRTPGPSTASTNLRGGGGLNRTRSPSRTRMERSGSNAGTSTAGRSAVEGMLEGLRGRSQGRDLDERGRGGRQGSGRSESRGRRDGAGPPAVRGGAAGSRDPSRGRTPTRPSHLSPARETTGSPLRPVVSQDVDDQDNAGASDDDDADSEAPPPPAILRGLLHLTLSKPSRIKKISLRFKGVSRTDWPEGIGPRRLEVMEEHELVSFGVTYFDASAPVPDAVSAPATVAAAGSEVTVRRAASLGPDDYAGAGRGRSPSVALAPLPGPSTNDDEAAISRRRATARALSMQPARRLPGSEHWGPDGVPHAHPQQRHLDSPPLPAAQRSPSIGAPSIRMHSVARIGEEEESPARARSSTVSDAASSIELHDGDGTSSAPVPGTARSSLERAAGPHTFQPSTSLTRSPSRPPVEVPEDDPPSFQSIVGESTTRRPTSSETHRKDAASQLASEASIRSVSKTRFSLPNLIKRDNPATTAPSSASTSNRRAESPARRPAGRSKSRGRATGLKAIKDALVGLSHGGDDGDSDSDEKTPTTTANGGSAAAAVGWREFKAGTYTYPISLPIPSDLPPTLHCDFGSVVFRLKATVVRAGALTSNLHAEREVHLVLAPGEDDTDETESIVVSRDWGTQLSYTVAFSGKRFTIGGQIPVTIRLLPTAKMKLWRLSAVLEEKVDYTAHGKKITRHEGVKTFPLLKIEYPDLASPLLPLLSDEPDAVQRSPLSSFWINPTSSDNMTPACLDPLGPWDLEGALQLPDCTGRIHFSCAHDKANISIKHWVKVTMRVERGDDEFLDAKGKRKRWDIIIESPVNILSCRCSTNVLPAYSYYAPGSSDRLVTRDVCSCPPPTEPGGRPTFGHGHASHLAPGSVFPQAPQPPAAPTTGTHGPRVDRTIARGDMVLDVAPDAGPNSGPTRGRHEGDEDPIGRSRHLARLLAGVETEGGEAPPAYAVVNGAPEGGISTQRPRAGSEASRGRSPIRGGFANGQRTGRSDGSGSGSSRGRRA